MSKLTVVRDPGTECVIVMGGHSRSERGLFIAMSALNTISAQKDPIEFIKAQPTIPALEGFDEVPAGTLLNCIECENDTAFFQLQNEGEPDASIVFTAGYYPGNLFTIKVPVSGFIELLGAYKDQFGPKEEPKQEPEQAPAKPAKAPAKAKPATK